MTQLINILLTINTILVYNGTTDAAITIIYAVTITYSEYLLLFYLCCYYYLFRISVIYTVTITYVVTITVTITYVLLPLPIIYCYHIPPAAPLQGHLPARLLVDDLPDDAIGP